MPTDDDTAAGRSRSTLEEAADVLGRSARSALSDLLGAIDAYAQQNKGAAAKQMSDYAAAAEDAAARLAERDNALGARLVGEAATQMTRASSAVEEATPDSVADGLERAARRNPAAFVAGAVLVGVGLGYLLKAAASDRGTGGEAAPSPRLPTNGSSPERRS